MGLIRDHAKYFKDAAVRVWDMAGKRIESNIQLKTHVEVLRRETRFLMNTKTEVLLEVERSAHGNKRLTRSALTWFEEVDKVVDDVRKFLSSLPHGFSLEFNESKLAGTIGVLLKEICRLQRQKMSLHVLEKGTKDPITLLLSMMGDLERETRYLMDTEMEVLREIKISMWENRGLTASKIIWCQEVDNVVVDVRELQNSYKIIGDSYVQSIDQTARLEKLLQEVRRLQKQRTVLSIVKDTVPNSTISSSSMVQNQLYGSRYRTMATTKMLDNLKISALESSVHTFCTAHFMKSISS